MFAPVGYIPLIDIFDESISEAHQVYEYVTQGNTHILRFTVEMPDDIRGRWTMEFCRNSLYLADGVSAPTRISDTAIPYTHFYWGIINGMYGKETVNILKLNQELLDPYQLCTPVLEDDIFEFNDRINLYLNEGDIESKVFEVSLTWDMSGLCNIASVRF